MLWCNFSNFLFALIVVWWRGNLGDSILSYFNYFLSLSLFSCLSLKLNVFIPSSHGAPLISAQRKNKKQNTWQLRWEQTWMKKKKSTTLARKHRETLLLWKPVVLCGRRPANTSRHWRCVVYDCLLPVKDSQPICGLVLREGERSWVGWGGSRGLGSV